MSGNIEVTLPSYMTTLSQEELNEARRAAQRDQMIVASGRKTNDGDIVLMTATGHLMLLRVEGHELPHGKALPIDCGFAVAIEDEGYYACASDWVIANAEPMPVELLASPTYSNEDPTG